MKKLFALFQLLVVVLLFGCSTGKQLTQKNEDAQSYYNSGNYSDALSAYSEIISIYESNNNLVACPVYTQAGESALITGDAKLAIDYLKKATNSNFSNEETYYYLADAYNKVDNLSLEMTTLADYLEKYPEGKEVSDVKSRLYYTYFESDNFDKALELWAEVYANDKNNTKLLESYFDINNSLDNIDTCDIVASKLLIIDPEDITALSWFGKKYYRKAEDLYQKEMKAYEMNKTNKQYRILLKALDVVTDEFKTSLSYFDKLYTLQPTPENANYLSHIYGRLSDEKKKAYYKKLAK